MARCVDHCRARSPRAQATHARIDAARWEIPVERRLIPIQRRRNVALHTSRNGVNRTITGRIIPVPQIGIAAPGSNWM